jgi:hypothetical protein
VDNGREGKKVMLQSVEGIYKNGRIELLETPTNIEEGRVIITFLEAKSTQEPQKLMTFGMFSGANRSTEEDFTIAEFHGDGDDRLDWS